MFISFLGATSGCDNRYGQGAAACAPGAALECTCEEGAEGWQVCSAQGVMGACECPGGGVVLPGDDDPDVVLDEPYALLIEPEALYFGEPGPGQEALRQATIINQGPGAVRLRLQVEEGQDGEDLRRELTLVSPQERVGHVLEAGESLEVEVRYAPVDEQPDRGVLWVTAHDGLTHGVALEGTSALPDIEGPGALELGSVLVGGAARRSAFLKNVGGAPLEIEALELEGSAEFSMCWTMPGELDALRCQEQPGDVPMVLAPGEVVRAQVTYRPRDDGQDRAMLRVASNDPNEPELLIPVLGQGATTCLRAEADLLDFGQVALGARALGTVALTNCSPTRPVTLVDTRVVGDEAFLLGGEVEPGLRLAPGERVEVEVIFSPRTERRHEGELVVVSSAFEGEPLRVPLVGQGFRVDQCPVARAGVRVEGSGRPFEALIEAQPLDTVELTAAGSLDPDEPDAPLSFEWAIVERPEDSTSVLFPSNTMPHPSLFLDLAGRYVIELQVFDHNGTPACAAARVTILTISREDIHVQLVWNTPRDPDQTDEDGTDMDLHMLHPRGRWSAAPYDCHWLNTEPDWGARGGGDDPSLDIDDTNGAGPENINLTNPEAVRYRVGVHYYSDNGMGRSDATIRVFLGGMLAFEALDQVMRAGQFWEAALIDWSTVEVTPLDILHDEVP